MMISTDVVLWLSRTTLALTLAAVLVLVLRNPVRRWLGASAVWRLWLTFPAAWLWSQLPAVPEFLPSYVPSSLALSLPEVWAVPSDSADTHARRLMLLAWMAGALLSAMWQWHLQRRFVQSLGELVPLHQGIWQGRNVPGLPALVGLWRPRIVIPENFATRYSAKEQVLVLLHERIHLQRGDMWINAVVAVMTCLYWFNPMIWWAARASRMDLELSCDERVIASGVGARRSYGQALLKSCSEAARSPVGCHWHVSDHPLHERMRLLKRPVAGKVQTAMGWAVAALLATVAGWTSWQGGSVVRRAPIPELSELSHIAGLSGGEGQGGHPVWQVGQDDMASIGADRMTASAISVATVHSPQGMAGYGSQGRWHIHRCAAEPGRPGRRI